MLGFRGCRLGIVYSEISEMQARAVFEAAAEVQKAGIKVKPEVMIPLVGFKRELDLQAEVVHRVAKEVMAEKKVTLTYSVGTMIEVPRGALTADEIAPTAEFFSFGTNAPTLTGGMPLASRHGTEVGRSRYPSPRRVKLNPGKKVALDFVRALRAECEHNEPAPRRERCFPAIWRWASLQLTRTYETIPGDPARHAFFPARGRAFARGRGEAPEHSAHPRR